MAGKVMVVIVEELPRPGQESTYKAALYGTQVLLMGRGVEAVIHDVLREGDNTDSKPWTDKLGSMADVVALLAIGHRDVKPSIFDQDLPLHRGGVERYRLLMDTQHTTAKRIAEMIPGMASAVHIDPTPELQSQLAPALEALWDAGYRAARAEYGPREVPAIREAIPPKSIAAAMDPLKGLAPGRVILVRLPDRGDIAGAVRGALRPGGVTEKIDDKGRIRAHVDLYPADWADDCERIFPRPLRYPFEVTFDDSAEPKPGTWSWPPRV